jgi:hypothetical protein
MNTGAMMAKKPQRKANPDEVIAKALKVRREYAEWMERLAAFDRSTVAGMMDRALARYAQEIGFNERPPQRTP